MERALNIASLTSALGEHASGIQNFPSPRQLQNQIADAEVRLFANQFEVPDQLVNVAWYLHGVASASIEFGLYDETRQRRAFQVSAHIFDLALLGGAWSRDERLRLGFAAQIGYHRGEQEPNAIAVWQRIRDLVEESSPLLDRIHCLGLEAGVALLGLERQFLFRLLRTRRGELGELRRQIEIDNLGDTMFGAPTAVVDGVNSLLHFLAFGDRDQLVTARRAFANAVEADTSAGDLDSRWVAAHLQAIVADMEDGSVWSLLPPDLPPHTYQAMTLTDPPILTLWKPQRELIRSTPSVLHPDTRRVIMSLPTSAGKTLLAQLLMVAHLSMSDTSICYVAPMRSLGREMRRAMRSRLIALQKELGRDLPDFLPTEFENFPEIFDLLVDLDDQPTNVDVMTPERLSNLLRHDPQAVLDRYGLFIFDEAHLLGERGRGIILESVLSFLHWRTRNNPHRIVLLSSAFGNRGQLMAWLDPEGNGLLYESEWRGPRRLHALFNTRVDWTRRTEQSVHSQNLPVRYIHPLYGRIRLRPAEDSRVQSLELADQVGDISFRTDPSVGPRLYRESSRSTPVYRTVAQLAIAIGHGGALLVVVSTRADARRMAQAICDLLDSSPNAQALAEFVRLRLSSDHPLVRVLQHGVAYHHAGLPVDVLEAIEDAVRDGRIRYVASTTSLTEGVNLPVRTVILSETRYEGQQSGALLRGARLLNAMGRAGRACKECEGWIVLVLNQAPSADDFGRMDVDVNQLIIESRLAETETLEALVSLETQLRSSEDALYQVASTEAANFISFVWFVLSSEEERQISPRDVDLGAVLESTLAHVQLNQLNRNILARVADHVRRAYSVSDPIRRRAWSKFGTTIGSARLIYGLADELAKAASQAPAPNDVDEALRLLGEVDVIHRLLELPEAPGPWVFRVSPSGATQLIEVEIVEVLRDWIKGVPMATLADTYLADVTRPEYRVEQMVDAVTRHFEHFLSWTLGAVIEQANQILATSEAGTTICPSLPLFVRYGIDSDQALKLLTSGVRSREFANTVAEKASTFEIDSSDLRFWIRGMSIVHWRVMLGASAADVLDLLEYARIQGAGLLRELLEDGEVAVELDEDLGIDRSVEVLVEPASNEPLSQLVARQAGESEPLAHIPTRFHTEVQAILDTGLSLRSMLKGSEVRLKVVPDET